MDDPDPGTNLMAPGLVRPIDDEDGSFSRLVIIFDVIFTRPRVLTNGLVTVGDSLHRTSTSNLKRRRPERAPGSLRENGTPINVFVLDNVSINGDTKLIVEFA